MIRNEQPPEQLASGDGFQLDVHSIFYTIQGEGPFAGTPAVFIRLAGCNLQCPFCDTQYTEGRKIMQVEDIVARVRRKDWSNLPRPLVVITGGEPFRQNIEVLVKQLVFSHCYVQIETNGKLPPPNFPWSRNIGARYGAYIVCSPKKSVHPETMDRACALKYVLTAGQISLDDGLPLGVLGYRTAPERPPSDSHCPVYVQPADEQDDEKNEKNMKAALAASMRFGYILQLQIHKLLGME